MCRGNEKWMQNLDRLTGKHKQIESLERQRCDWNDNIKIGWKHIELEEVEWIDLTQNKNKRWACNRDMNITWFLRT